MSIQRYAMTGYDDADAWLAPDDDGLWVTHADHIKSVNMAAMNAYMHLLIKVDDKLAEEVSQIILEAGR